MSKHKFDEIEDFFRSNLKEENLGESEWLLPDDYVFEGAMARVAVEKRRKRRIWLFPGLAGSAFMLGVFYFTTFLNSETSNQSLHTEYVIEEKKALLNISENMEAEFQKGYVADDQTKFIPEDKASKELQQIIPSDEPTREKENISWVDSMDKQANLLDSIALLAYIADSALFHAKEIITIQSLNGISGGIFPLEKNEYNNLNKADLNPNSQMLPVQEVVNRKMTKDRRLSLYFGLNYATMHMYGPIESGVSLTNYDKLYPGNAAQLKYETGISNSLRWYVSGSVIKMNNESLLHNTHIYDKAQEAENEKGELMYYGNHEIENPMGTLTRGLSFFVGDEEINDGGILDNETTIQQRFTLVSAGVGLGYEFLRLDRFNASVHIGPAFSYVTDYQGSFETEMKHKEKLMLKESFKEIDRSSFNRVLIDLNLGGDISFKLSDKFSIKYDLSYSRHLRSIRLLDENAMVRTFPGIISSNIGFQYQF